MGPLALALSALNFIRKHWKLILAGVTVAALGAYIGYLNIDASWLRADLNSANIKVTQQAQLRRAAEEDAAQQHSYLAQQIEVNQANAAMTEKFQQLVLEEKRRADKAKDRADVLDRSYTALIGRLNDVDGNAPLSDQQRAFVRELWCLEQSRHDPPSGCPATD